MIYCLTKLIDKINSTVMQMKVLFSAFMELVVYVCISGVISNVVGYLVPRNNINADSFPYKSFSWEHNGEVYDRINVRKWKNKVPDLSRYVNFLYKKHLESRPTSEQLDRLIRESCVAEFVHIMLIVATPLCYLSIDSGYSLLFSVLYALGNLPYIIIQRYNRPTFKRIYVKLLEKEKSTIDLGGKSIESADIVL